VRNPIDHVLVEVLLPPSCLGYVKCISSWSPPLIGLDVSTLLNKNTYSSYSSSASTREIFKHFHFITIKMTTYKIVFQNLHGSGGDPPSNYCFFNQKPVVNSVANDPNCFVNVWISKNVPYGGSVNITTTSNFYAC
jgi:hypothetical protein